jgi:hypothetical protein
LCTTLTLTAAADSWIDSASQSSNKGSDTVLRVQAMSGGNQRALVYFDLSGIPADCTIESAALRLYASSQTSGRTLRALRITGNWTESGVTWNNQPSTNSTYATTGSGSGWRQWDVTSQLQAMLTGSNYGFLIRDANEGGSRRLQQFHSRERGENMPQLIITFTAPPPPDTAAPDTTISSAPSNPTTDENATFLLSASEPGSTFECALDGIAFAMCASPVHYAGLALGQHSFEVRATDLAGNTDATPAIHTWTIEPPPPDITPPETTIDSGPANPTSSTEAAFNFSASEPDSIFECSLDSSAFAACVPSSTYSALADGAHNFSVRATDSAGNVDATPATYTWVVDTSAPLDCGPQITLSASADAWVDQGSPSSNKGSDSILKVMSKSSNNLRAFVQFYLPAAPQGCVVQAATLRLYAASSRTGRTLQALQVNSSWTENSVTWNNQPATTGAAATTSSGSGWREWNVVAIVQAMYDSGMNNGFLLRDATENNDAEQQFHGREKGESIPQLVITFGPAP